MPPDLNYSMTTRIVTFSPGCSTTRMYIHYVNSQICTIHVQLIVCQKQCNCGIEDQYNVF